MKYELFNGFKITVERKRKEGSYKYYYHIIYYKNNDYLTDDFIYTITYFETSTEFLLEIKDLINKSITLLLENELINIFDINFQVIDMLIVDLLRIAF